MYYSPQVLTKAGFDHDKNDAILASIPIAFVNCIGTLISAKLIDKIGRRGLMIRTLPLIATSLMLLSIAFYLINYSESNEASWIALFSLTSFVLFFAIGMSTTPWTVNSEIFPI